MVTSDVPHTQCWRRADDGDEEQVSSLTLNLLENLPLIAGDAALLTRS